MATVGEETLQQRLNSAPFDDLAIRELPGIFSLVFGERSKDHVKSWERAGDGLGISGETLGFMDYVGFMWITMLCFYYD